MSSSPAKQPEQDPDVRAKRVQRRENWQRRRWKLVLAMVLLLLTGLWLVRGRWAIPANPGEVLEQYYGSTRLLDRHGRVLELWTGAAGTRHRPVTLAKVARNLVLATLALEDQRFWQHPGVDVFATSRAAWQNLRAGRVVSGASTLTQQLCKWLDPRPRTLGDKAMEAIQAVQLEGVLTKDEILELYLSYAPYGGLQRGVEQASLAWLGKAPADVTLAEAAWLAVLPRSPSRLDPARDPAAALPDQRALLQKMRGLGWISEADLTTALAQPIRLVEDPTRHRAPHLAAWIGDHLPGVLLDRPRAIRTTIDADLCEAAATRARAHLATLADRHVGNAAIVAIDNDSGEVRVMVGSTSYSDAGHLGANNGAVALRQPGSTIKAFTYAAAFADADSPATLLPDLEAVYATPAGAWIPRNYGETLHGPVRARVALASSLNLPAVYLAQHIGLDKLQRTLAEAGLVSLSRDESHYGLGLTLGDGEVSLLELTNAFSLLGRMGRYRPARLIDEVVGWQGESARPPLLDERQVLPPAAVWQILDVLSDPDARALSFQRGGPLETPFQMAAKTGTSKGFRDNWAIGVTTRYTVGVWVGNFDGSAMRDVSGVTGAAPLLREVMVLLHGEHPPPPFERPEGLLRTAICPVSGLVATSQCGAATSEWLRPEQVPGPCTWHGQARIDRRNGLLAGPTCPPEQVELRHGIAAPGQYAEWASKQQGWLPTAYSPLCPAAATAPKAGALQVRVVQPADGASLLLDPHTHPRDRQIGLRAEVSDAAARLTWYVDGQAVGRPSGAEAQVLWTPLAGDHTITVEASLPGSVTAQGRARVRVR